MNEDKIIVAGTGHRPDKLGGYNREAYFKLKEVADLWLCENLHRVSHVISGMALGWDIALAHAAQEYDIPVVAAVPFKGQEANWSEQSQEFYHWILSKCSDIRIISDEQTTWAYQDRNKWMVDNCDLLLACWDGQKLGGTWNCVKYAKKKGTHIVNLYDHLTR